MTVTMWAALRNAATLSIEKLRVVAATVVGCAAMSYRRRDKAPFSAWLVAERTKRAWKAGEVARRLRELGYQAEESTYRTWEAGRRPSSETVIALERLFESAAPGDGAAAQTDVAAAIDRQTEAITALVDELRASRLDRERLEQLQATVDRLVEDALGPVGTPARAARVAPRESTGSGR